MKTFVRFFLILAALVVIAAFTILYAIFNSGSKQQEVLKETTFHEKIDDMEIVVENARVEFLPSTDASTRIRLTGNSNDFSLQTDVAGSRLTVEVEDRSGFFNFGFNRSYSLQVFVPENGVSTLAVESDNGAIDAEKIAAAEVTLEADNGRIELDTVDTDRLNVDTDNGRILVANVDADMTVRSSNGRVTFTDVSGEIAARANNGRIELTTDMLDFPVDFETDNGRIEIRTETAPSNARIEALVDNGSISLFGQDTQQVSFGSGEVLIRLITNNGSINVD